MRARADKCVTRQTDPIYGEFEKLAHGKNDTADNGDAFDGAERLHDIEFHVSCPPRAWAGPVDGGAASLEVGDVGRPRCFWR
jgi:hypothetical protein